MYNPKVLSTLFYYEILLAFNGKKSAEIFFNHKVEYGLQLEKIDSTDFWVLPSTSGAARGSWNENYWRELALKLI